MLRSLYSGVSGLKNHQIRMDVIGNNIANVNTTGFKSGRVTFQDILSQTLSGAASPKDNVGGVNPKQVGLGMNVASIDTLFKQGSLQTTGNKTDLAIQGDGFFILRDGDKISYTRAGAFNIDKDGTLVNPANGLKVQGWMGTTDQDGNAKVDTQKEAGDIVIPLYKKDPAHETTDIKFKCNMDANSPVEQPDWTAKMRASAAVTTSIDTYDSEGAKHRMILQLWKTGVNTWTASAAITDIDQGTPLTQDVKGGTPNTSSRINLAFDNFGSLRSVQDTASGDIAAKGKLNSTLSFNVNGKKQNIKLDFGNAGEYNGITQFSSQTTTVAYTQNGYGMGYMDSFSIDDSGTITGVYSNGRRIPEAKIALANFINPGGLEKDGENRYLESNNSGLAEVGLPGSAGRGKILAGTLEMSNVDLAEQFTDMIVTQRGFQANTKIVTTSDQILQDLLALKR